MPEIIEYLKLLNQLKKPWTGRRILRFTAPPSSPNPKKYYQGEWSEFKDLVSAKPIRCLERLGKNLLVHFEGQPKFWHIHLNSTGWWMPGNDLAQHLTYTNLIAYNFLHKVNDQNVRVRMEFDDGQWWHYHDPRTWGKWHLRTGQTARDDDYLQQIGPDWMDEMKEATIALCHLETERPRTIKEILCDQQITAGLGNYLACEICHTAGIHPHTLWRNLSNAQRMYVADATWQTLKRELTQSDHSKWRVFDKKDEECLTCLEKRTYTAQSKIRYKKDGNQARGSYYCAVCQPMIHPPVREHT